MPGKRKRQQPVVVEEPVADMSEEPSPIRMKRTEERDELQWLNKRLEYYILKRREQDSNGGSHRRHIELLVENHKKEVSTITTRHKEQVTTLRTAQSTSAVELGNKMEEYGQNTHKIAVLEKEVEQLNKNAVAQKERLSKITQQYKDSQQNVFIAQDDAKTSGRDLENANAKIENLKETTDKALKELQEATTNAIDAQTHARNCQEDLDLMQNKTDTQIKELGEQLKVLNKDRGEIEDELRKEFGRQLKDIFKERQRQFEMEKAEGLAELKKQYDEKMARHMVDMENIIHSRDEATSRVVELEVDLEDNNRRTTEAESSTAALTKKVANLEEQVYKSQERHRKQVDELKTSLSEVRTDKQQKDKDYDDLMDVKIALAMEIKAYRLLLENEEDRLGMTEV